ncbi:phosphotransferase enzyme family protein [Maribacter sp. CXY002]|uniref:phosphotransferase enzyme family protein n=1 Tax=Maribacter luteocoastalis TaxID=3407671 RepID=UPI003B6796CB
MELKKSKYTPEELNAILGYFAIVKREYTYSSLTAGYINDTFLVSSFNQPLYILQRINTEVFKDVSGLMQNITTALEALQGSDYSSLKYIHTLSGGAYAETELGFWRLVNYIPNSITYTTTNDTDIAFEAGRVIGKFHLLLQKESISGYVDTVPKFHNLEFRKEQFTTALASAKNDRIKIAENALITAQNILAKLNTFNLKDLPIRICHNDTKLNNILFSQTSKKALCLIDLDTIMKGYFLYDFGDAVRTIVNAASEDEKDHGKITFDTELFNAIAKGLASNTAFLTKNEIKSLPIGVFMMPFLHGLRALTDYLNGNIYYKVTYENQNLDRCLSLFDFTVKAQKQIPFMEEVLSDVFTNDKLF